MAVYRLFSKPSEFGVSHEMAGQSVHKITLLVSRNETPRVRPKVISAGCWWWLAVAGAVVVYPVLVFTGWQGRWL
jgi:hypothetical protein